MKTAELRAARRAIGRDDDEIFHFEILQHYSYRHSSCSQVLRSEEVANVFHQDHMASHIVETFRGFGEFLVEKSFAQFCRPWPPRITLRGARERSDRRAAQRLISALLRDSRSTLAPLPLRRPTAPRSAHSAPQTTQRSKHRHKLNLIRRHMDGRR